MLAEALRITAHRRGNLQITISHLTFHLGIVGESINFKETKAKQTSEQWDIEIDSVSDLKAKPTENRILSSKPAKILRQSYSNNIKRVSRFPISLPIIFFCSLVFGDALSLDNFLRLRILNKFLGNSVLKSKKRVFKKRHRRIKAGIIVDRDWDVWMRVGARRKIIKRWIETFQHCSMQFRISTIIV